MLESLCLITLTLFTFYWIILSIKQKHANRSIVSPSRPQSSRMNVQLGTYSQVCQPAACHSLQSSSTHLQQPESRLSPQISTNNNYNILNGVRQFVCGMQRQSKQREDHLQLSFQSIDCSSPLHSITEEKSEDSNWRYEKNREPSVETQQIKFGSRKVDDDQSEIIKDGDLLSLISQMDHKSVRQQLSILLERDNQLRLSILSQLEPEIHNHQKLKLRVWELERLNHQLQDRLWDKQEEGNSLRKEIQFLQLNRYDNNDSILTQKMQNREIGRLHQLKNLEESLIKARQQSHNLQQQYQNAAILVEQIPALHQQIQQLKQQLKNIAYRTEVESPQKENNRMIQESANYLLKNSPGINSKFSTVIHYGFLQSCKFLELEDRQFIYSSLNRLITGILKTEKLYNSLTNWNRDFHDVIDDVKGILLIIQLQNGKILGAYTHQAFTFSQPNGNAQNIAFLFDISQKKAFTNLAGINSIQYDPKRLIWGLSQLVISFNEPGILYTHFCRSHNIYWDGNYSIENFIGQNKEWASVQSYEIFRVMKD